MATVLVVDDAAIQRDLVARWLEHCGYTPRTAASAKDAWQVLRTETVDVVVLDVSMPEMDGISFLRVLRRYPAHAQTPVIMLTEMEDRGMILEAGKLGVREYLLKSRCTVDALIDRIRRHLTKPAPLAASA